jgi:UDP-glucose 4-epimerase
VDVVFHLISSTLPATSNQDMEFDLTSNVLPTLQLLQMAQNSGVQKLIFISSGGAVYGIAKRLPVAEDDSTNPISAYGIHKLAIEKYLDLFHTHWKINYGILRVSNPYGLGQPANRSQGVIAQFVHKAAVHEPLEIWGDGSVIRDFIHVDDVVDAFLLLVRHDGPFRIFNIGSGQGHSLLQLVSTIEAMIGETLAVRFTQARSVDVPANVLDIARAKTELRWQPRRSLTAGIGEMLEDAMRSSGVEIGRQVLIRRGIKM